MHKKNNYSFESSKSKMNRLRNLRKLLKFMVNKL